MKLIKLLFFWLLSYPISHQVFAQITAEEKYYYDSLCISDFQLLPQSYLGKLETGETYNVHGFAYKRFISFQSSPIWFLVVTDTSANSLAVFAKASYLEENSPKSDAYRYFFCDLLNNVDYITAVGKPTPAGDLTLKHYYRFTRKGRAAIRAIMRFDPLKKAKVKKKWILF